MFNLVGKRTIIFNAVMAVILIYNVVAPDAPVMAEEEVASFVDRVIEHVDLLIAIVGNVILRFKTKTPVFQKL